MPPLKSTKGAGQTVVALLAIVVIGVAAYVIVKQARPKKEGRLEGVFFYCTSCKKEFVDRDQDAPIKCARCGQMTGVYLRKCRCKECGGVFRAYLLKWDPELKRLRERRRRGENVPPAESEDELVSAPDEEDWIDSASPEGIGLITDVVCPKCSASGKSIEAAFPKEGNEKK